MATYGNNKTSPMTSGSQKSSSPVERQASRYAKFLPIAYIDKVVLESPGTTPLKATIDFCIKEKLGEGTINEWINNPSLKKNLKIKLIQSTSRKTTEDLSFNINIEDVSNVEVISDITIDDVIGGPDNNIENYSEEDSNGDTIMSLYFRRSFNINNANPSHLSYFILTYLDTSNNKVRNGYISKEVIIDDEVRSKLIQDFRIFKQIKDIPIDLSFVDRSRDALYGKIQSLAMDNMSPKGRESYFSEIFLSRNRLNQANFIFAIDYYKIIRDSSVFGGLYENINSKNQGDLSNLSSIVSISLKRRRVKESSASNKLGSSISNTSPFERETIAPEILATTQDVYGKLEEVADDDYGIKEVHISTNSKTNISYASYR